MNNFIALRSSSPSASTQHLYLPLLLRPALLLVLLLPSLSFGQYTSKGTQNGVEIGYRWNHPVGKPSELLVQLKNTEAQHKHVELAIDLYYQGRTVESLEADTCIRSHQSLTGKLNGIRFVPERLTREQLKDGGAEIDIVRTVITAQPCP